MCGGPKWKREVVPDHKVSAMFSSVCTALTSTSIKVWFYRHPWIYRQWIHDAFEVGSCVSNRCINFYTVARYLWLYIIVFKSFLVYVSDIFSAITMLTTSNWSNEIFQKCQSINGCVFIPFNTGKWLFVGCIIFSFLLASIFPSITIVAFLNVATQLAYESRKAKIIIASRDISYAFTNVMANNYYSLRRFKLLPDTQFLLISFIRFLRSFLFLWSYQQLHQN